MLFKNFFKILSGAIFFFGLLAVPLLTNAKTLEELGLTQEDVKYLTPTQLDKLLNDETEVRPGHLGDASSTPLSAALPNTVACFDYYKFGSIEVDIKDNLSTVAAGTIVPIEGVIHNTNPYPVVNGALVIKIFKERNTIEKDINGPEVVDQFAIKDISIPAKGSIPFKTEWKIPATTRSGEYSVVTFFTVADKFNLLGLTFTDDIIGNSNSFTVAGQTTGVFLNKENVKINDGPLYFASFAPKVPKDTAAVFEVEVVNTTNKIQEIPVVWKVYSWDAQHEKNLLKEVTEKVTVPAAGTVKVKHQVTDASYPVYYVVAESSFKDAKSILGMRFTREGVGAIRINFPSIVAYPLEKDAPTALFSCLHSVSEPIVKGGKLILNLKDSKNRLIHSYEYVGDVTGEMMGVKSDFTPLKTYKDFSLEALLYKDDVLVDSATLNYQCEKLNADGCAKVDPWLMAGLGVIVLLIIIWIIIAMRKRHMKTLLLVLGFGIVFAFGSSVEAKNVLTSSAPSYRFAYYDGFGSSPWEVVLGNVTTQIKYSAQVTKLTAAGVDTGELVNDGAVLPIGSKIKLQIIPHGSRDISWNGTGYDMDTPYGAWGANAAPIRSCDIDDYLYSYYIEDFDELHDMYISLVVAPPVTQIPDVAGLSCDGSPSNSSRTCTVTQAVPISPQFQYAATEGKFFYSSKMGDKFIDKNPDAPASGPQLKSSVSCYSSNIPMRSVVPTGFDVYTLSVPVKSISFSFTGIPNTDNNPPSNPTIVGPTTGYVDQTYSFAFNSTDPDNDQVRYGVDWTSGGTVNQWVPVSGHVADETDQTATKSWTTPGTYTFKVKAQDSEGADSGWSTHTINIITDRCTNVAAGQSSALFSAHGRDYFFSIGEGAEGTLYFTPSASAAGAVCQIDMCANTEAIEAPDKPEGYEWNLNAADSYTKYSCVEDTGVVCSCSGRTYSCTDNGVTVSSVPDAPQCALTASCSYGSPSGNQITFNYSATNVLGSLLNGGPVVKNIPDGGVGILAETRELGNTGDGQTSNATCEYPYDTSADPEIITFEASKIVEQGTSCVFTWETQDMTSCTLGGQGVAQTGALPFSTALGKNITKSLSCTTDEDVPQIITETRTCLVKPKVKEQ